MDIHVTAAVVGVLADFLGCDTGDISFTTTLKDIGLDSLELLEVGLELEAEFGRAAYIGSEDLAHIKTVADLIEHITSRL